jgi:hypothetical protein
LRILAIAKKDTGDRESAIRKLNARIHWIRSLPEINYEDSESSSYYESESDGDEDKDEVVGLTQAQIEMFPAFKYQDEKDAECTICMAHFEPGETLRRLQCFHIYHTNCIDQWLKTSSKCPLCNMN